MSPDNFASQHFVSLQERLLRLAERDYQLTAKVLSAETGIPIATLASYRKGTMMPALAMAKLCSVIPDELTSMMFEPVGKHIGSNEPGEGDLDALGRAAAALTSDYVEAISDGIVTPMERANLKDRARRITPLARAVAA